MLKMLNFDVTPDHVEKTLQQERTYSDTMRSQLSRYENPLRVSPIDSYD